MGDLVNLKARRKQARRQQHQRAPGDEQSAQHGAKQWHVQPRQQREPERQAQQPADQKGREAQRLEATPHGEGGEQLAGECAGHGQYCGQARLQRPGPDRHRGEAEAEARQPLDEAGQRRAEDDDDQ